MRLCSLFVILFISVSCLGQAPRPSGFPTVNSPSAFYNLFGTLDSAKMFVQRDSFVAKYPSIIYHLNGNMYFNKGGIGSFWLPFTLASIRKVFAGYGLLNANDSTLQADSAVLANYFLRKRDSLVTYVTPKNLSDTSIALRNFTNTETARAIAAENLKVNISDTSAAFTPYRNAINKNTDSLTSHNTRIISNTNAIAALNADTSTLISRFALKVNYTDTAAMLLGYKTAINKNTDSITAHNIRIGANTTNIATNTSDIVLRVKYTDTSAMLLNYRNKINQNTDSISAHNIRIGANTTNIATNTTNISTNATNITNEIARATAAEANKLDTTNAILNYVLNKGNTSAKSGAVGGWQVGNYINNYWGDTLYHMGNSLTTGAGSTAGYDYPSQLKLLTSKPFINYGIYGTNLTQSFIGDSSFIDRLYRIPIRNTINAYIIEYSTNDVRFNKTIQNIRIAWVQGISYMVGKGVNPKKIILIGNTRDYQYTTNQTLAYSADTCLQNICAEFGVGYISLRNLIANNGGMALVSSDSLHLNNTGYGVFANAVYSKLVYRNSDSSKISIAGNANIDSSLFVGKSIVAKGVNANKILVNQGATFYNGIYADSANLPNIVANSINLPSTTANINFGNMASTGNKILIYDGGDSAHRIGFGYKFGASTSLHSFSPLPLLFGMGNDAKTMNTSNAGFYLDNNNSLNVNNTSYFNSKIIVNRNVDYGYTGADINGSVRISGVTNLSSPITYGNAGVSQNNFLVYDGAADYARMGFGITPSGGFGIFGKGVNGGTIIFGNGKDASSLTTANSAFYVNSNNQLNFRNTVNGTITYGNAGVSQNNFLVYDGAADYARMGFGLTPSGGFGIFGNGINGGTMIFGNGKDASSLTTANSAFYVNSNNQLNFRNTVNGTITYGSAGIPQNNFLVYDGAADYSRMGFGLTPSGGFGIFGNGINGGTMIFGNGKDASSLTTANSAFYVNQNDTVFFNLPPKINSFTTAGIVTNNASGLLATSTGTGFVKSTAGVVSYDTRTYIDSIRQPSDALYGNAAFSVSGTTGISNATLNSQTANTVFAAPNGSSGTPTFRSIDSNYFGGNFSTQVNAAATAKTDTARLILDSSILSDNITASKALNINSKGGSLVLIGDSFFEPVGSSTNYNGMAGIIGNLLTSSNSKSVGMGSGYYMQSNGFLRSFTQTNIGMSANGTFTGSGGSNTYTLTAGQSIKVTGRAYNYLDLYYIGYSSTGSLTYSRNGTTLFTKALTTTGAFQTTYPTIVDSALILITDTLTITATGTVVFYGVSTFVKTDAAPYIYVAGFSGLGLNDVSGQIPWSEVAGFLNNTSTPLGSKTLLIELGVNNMASNSSKYMSPTQMTTQMATIVSVIKGLCGNSTNFIFTVPTRTNESIYPVYSPYLYSDYVTAISNFCTTNGYGCVRNDLSQLGIFRSALHSDGVHLNDAGAQLAAKKILETLPLITSTYLPNPLTTTGDIIYSSSGSTATRLPIGSTNQVLTVSGGVPSWATRNTAIAGTTTNDAAVAGNVGENVESEINTATNYTTTATYQPVTSITLTAGDWDLSAIGTFNTNTATITAAANAIFVVSTTTASATGATAKNTMFIPQAALLGTSAESSTSANYRISIASTTTYYLNTQATFTLGNPQFTGFIRARRMR